MITEVLSSPKKPFQADVADPLHYDFVINTGRISIEEAVEAISFFWTSKSLRKIKRTMPLEDSSLEVYVYFEKPGDERDLEKMFGKFSKKSEVKHGPNFRV